MFIRLQIYTDIFRIIQNICDKLSRLIISLLGKAVGLFYPK